MDRDRTQGIEAETAKHSPGPFHVCGLDDGTLQIVSDNEPDAIAELPYYEGEANEDRQRANAALFSASLDLLAVCEEVKTLALRAPITNHADIQSTLRVLLDHACDAIAKATPRT
jgi:hypothetical protein